MGTKGRGEREEVGLLHGSFKSSRSGNGIGGERERGRGDGGETHLECFRD